MLLGFTVYFLRLIFNNIYPMDIYDTKIYINRESISIYN